MKIWQIQKNNIFLAIVFIFTFTHPFLAHAITCNAFVFIDLSLAAMAPGSSKTITLTLGAGSIEGGTTATFTQLLHDLDCNNLGPSFNLPCTDQGSIFSYKGDTTITSTCGTCSLGSLNPGIACAPVGIGSGCDSVSVGDNAGTCEAVVWSSNVPFGGSAVNQIEFTPTPSIAVPANMFSFCSLSYDIELVNLEPTSGPYADDTPNDVEILVGYTFPNPVHCDNSLTSEGSQSASIITCVSDIDNDGVCDNTDNCYLIYNPLQEDNDSDGIGNACDNCPNNSNPTQSDVDADGIGDVCDNCSMFPNVDQADVDADGVGNKCDNCANDANENQLDTDSDGIGDVCDICIHDRFNDADEDGICGDVDNCPFIANPDQIDSDQDDIGNPCDCCEQGKSDDDDGNGHHTDVAFAPFPLPVDVLAPPPLDLNCTPADLDGDGIFETCKEYGTFDIELKNIEQAPKPAKSPEDKNTGCSVTGLNNAFSLMMAFLMFFSLRIWKRLKK